MYKKTIRTLTAIIISIICGIVCYIAKRAVSDARKGRKLEEILDLTAEVLELALGFALYTENKKAKNKILLMLNRLEMSYACNSDEYFVDTVQKTLSSTEDIISSFKTKDGEGYLYQQLADAKRALQRAQNAVFLFTY